MRVTPPPMNTCDGLKKLTTEASIWPIRLPARWMMALAAASPARLAWPTSTASSAALRAQALGQRGALAGFAPPRTAMRVIAGPAAIASTQPRLPQWQRGPAWSTQMWPTSPAEPLAPR